MVGSGRHVTMAVGIRRRVVHVPPAVLIVLDVGATEGLGVTVMAVMAVMVGCGCIRVPAICPVTVMCLVSPCTARKSREIGVKPEKESTK